MRSQKSQGDGLKWCDATDTVISNNYGNSYGGGASGCKLLRCAVVDNLCTNYEGYTYYNAGYGEADPRSKDLAGNPRLQGDAPDLGCYEPIPLGLMLLVK